MKSNSKSEIKKTKKKTISEKEVKVSKTWLAFQKAIKNPGIEILDLKAVLK